MKACYLYRLKMHIQKFSFKKNDDATTVAFYLINFISSWATRTRFTCANIMIKLKNHEIKT